MTRIDHRAAVPALNGAEGGQLQRRVLQDLERQWLDSWGLAHAAQADIAPAVPEQAPAATEASALNVSPARGGADSMTTANAPAAMPDAQRARAAAPSRTEDREADISAARQTTPSRGGVAASHPDVDQPAGAPPAPAFGVVDADGGPGGARAISAAQPFGTQLLASPLSPSMALSGVVGAAASSALAHPGTGEEPEAAHQASARPRLPQAADPGAGPQKLTLRELAPDQVLATLRDAQLDGASSRLAAQGLARALMEAGYAQVKVVVNGQPGRGDRAKPEDAPERIASQAAAPAPSISETALKESAHGN